MCNNVMWKDEGVCVILYNAPSLIQPTVVTDVEDEELRKQMEELQLANEEKAGDDDASDQEVDIND